MRWSVRLFRREWRQHVLVLTLLTVAVAAAVACATIAVNGSSTATDPFGGANARISLDGASPTAAERAISAARARFGEIDVTAHATVSVPGSTQQLDVRDQDPAGRYSANILDLRSGRYPAAAGEVALTDDTADLLGTEVGGACTIDGESATVVGLVENPSNFRDEFALVAPGTLGTPETYTLLVDLTADRQPLSDAGIGFSMEVLGNDVNEAAIAAVVLAATTLALALVGLLAAAAFLVVAQRRQRQLGMLAAIGATDRQVRVVMLASGAVTGTVAAVLGLAVGVAGWMLARPAVERAAAHRIERTDLPWPLLAGVLVLAVVAATLAAWWPARTIARLPVMAALSGRPPRPRPVRRPLVVAVAFIAAGAAAIAIADPLSTDVQPPLFVGGLLAVIVGTVLAAPGTIRVAGRVASRLPVAPRIAVRDLARYQGRSAAALSAITLGLALSIGIVGVAAAAEPPADEGDLSNREMLVLIGDIGTAASRDLTPAEVASLDRQADEVIAALGDDARAAPFDVAVSTRPSPDGAPRRPIELGVSRGEDFIEGRGYPYVATPEVLALYGIDPATLDPSAELLTARREPFVLLDVTQRPPSDLPLAVLEHVDLPTYDSAPSSLVTEAAMERHGWVPARAGWIVESTTPLTPQQIHDARAAAAAVGLAVETRSTHDELAGLRTGATVAGGLLAVGIIAVAVGLIRSTAQRDLRTLTATGASPRTRRALTASTAAGLALPAVVLGLTGAYLALVASYRADLGRLVPIPFGELLPLAVGTPLAAAALGWLLGGREPRAFARQELE